MGEELKRSISLSLARREKQGTLFFVCQAAAKMPTLQPMDECMMEVDLAPSLSAPTMPSKVNGVESDILLTKNISIDSHSPFSKIFSDCKNLFSLNQNENAKVLDSFTNPTSLLQETEQLTKEIKSLFEMNGFSSSGVQERLCRCLRIGAKPDYMNRNTTLSFVPNRKSLVCRKKNLVTDGVEILDVLPTRIKSNLPPIGLIKRPKLQVGSEVWVMKANSVEAFFEGTVVLIREEQFYKIRSKESKAVSSKLYSPKHLAYRKNSDVIVPVGTRIVACYLDGEKPTVYAGIVAEPPKFTNRERYLIFFDDGYAQYIEHKDIYVMCEQSNDVAKDVHKNISEFIQDYLQKYPERPMVKFQKNQITKTEHDRKWWDTKVLEVDASMANAEANRVAGKHRRHNIVPRKPHQPYVEYTRDVKEDDVVTIDSDSGPETDDKKNVNRTIVKPRNKARKSTTQKPRFPDSMRIERFHAPDIKSHLGYKRGRVLEQLSKSWERQIRKYVRGGPKLKILYRAPCGRHLRDLQEVLNYLILVNSEITIDSFTANPFVSILRTFRPREIFYQSADVTKVVAPVLIIVRIQLNVNVSKSQIMLIVARKLEMLAINLGRLKDPVITGIFECNSRCKCGIQCANRLVQNGLQVRLQMFKTYRKGWGIRCLDDLDAGTFICIYAGQLLTEEGADEDGNRFGDEYLAELDHIEVAEKLKEGYESDVTDIDVESEHGGDKDYSKMAEPSSSSDSDASHCETDSDFESSLRSTAVTTYTTRNKRRASAKNSDASSMSSVDSGNNKKSNKQLPDISSPLDSLKLNPRPLSPASAELLEKPN
ncbi:histone-lysine N-methyltransferase eggless [Caerostris extrusa]|uniref:Histone-lysine N-methyltransferase eggless n=1 Tax=Caerostris extrusa TaxID=172846 RepID=A0AAV4S1S0_CAEEX|nr:histone-lysine N-methyltransferase eggless [Caerostris extrusa]